MLTFQCPRCNRQLKAADGASGSMIHCFGCGLPILIEEKPLTVLPAPPRRLPRLGRPQRTTLIILAVVLPLALVIGITALTLAWGSMQASAPPAANCACPACRTLFYYPGVEQMTVPQQFAKKVRCPFCGNVDSVADFRVLILGGWPAPPPGERPEDMLGEDGKKLQEILKLPPEQAAKELEKLKIQGP